MGGEGERKLPRNFSVRVYSMPPIRVWVSGQFGQNTGEYPIIADDTRGNVTRRMIILLLVYKGVPSEQCVLE